MTSWDKWINDRGVHSWDASKFEIGNRVTTERYIQFVLDESKLLRRADNKLTTPLIAYYAATQLVISGEALDDIVAILRGGPEAFQRYEALLALEALPA